MTQIAAVTKIIDHEMAEIEVDRVSACGGNCASCGASCASGKGLRIAAKNTVRARVGDKVVVHSQTSKILGIAALVYLMPLAAFLIGYALAALLNLGESLSVIVSLLAFLFGVFLVTLVQRRLKKRPINYEITEIL